METKNDIGSIHAAALVAVALVVDLVQGLLIFLIGLIPFIGTLLSVMVSWVISVFVGIMFFLWFKIFCSVRFWGGSARKSLAFFGGFLLEFIPILNILPGWTLAVILTILFEKREKARYNKLARTQQTQARGELSAEPA